MPTFPLGPHFMTGGSVTRDWLERLKPKVLKCVGDYGVSQFAPTEALVVGREVDDGKIDGQGFDMNRMCLREKRDPMATAKLYVASVLDRAISLNPRVDVWEGPNEQVFEWEDEREARDPVFAATMQRSREIVMEWYANFLYHYSREIKLRGKRAAIGSWAVTWPQKKHNLWPFYRQALLAVRDFDAILTRHEYGPLDGTFSLRYRYDNDVYTSLGFPNLPVIISEWGSDYVAGWGPWKPWFGTMEKYCDELVIPYTVEIARDSYCLGATLFCDGGPDGWKDFNVSGTDIVDRLTPVAGELEKPVEEVVLVSDWSRYQGTFLGGDVWVVENYRIDIDWARLKASGIKGVIVRVGYGYRKDPCFDRFVAGLKSIGMPWGIYHFYLESLGPRQQAHLVRQWCPENPPLGVWADFEDGSGDATFIRCNTYLLELDSLFGRKTGIYSGGPYMNANFNLFEQTQWRGRPTWWAGYPNFITAAGWVGYVPNHVLHQFTDAYRLDGMPRPVDMSRLNRTLALDHILQDFPTDPTPEDNFNMLLSLRHLPDEVAASLESIVQELYADAQENRVGEYFSAGEAPTPAPQLPPGVLYLAKVKYDLTVRTATGALANRIVRAGDILVVMSEHETIGGWTNRARISTTGENVWMGDTVRGDSLLRF